VSTAVKMLLSLSTNPDDQLFFVPGSNCSRSGTSYHMRSSTGDWRHYDNAVVEQNQIQSIDGNTRTPNLAQRVCRNDAHRCC